jgi:hypothetical protein
MFVVLLAALALAVDSPAEPGGQTGAATAAPAAQAKAAKPKRVCREVEVTGSRTPKRVCTAEGEPAPAQDEAARGISPTILKNAQGNINTN